MFASFINLNIILLYCFSPDCRIWTFFLQKQWVFHTGPVALVSLLLGQIFNRGVRVLNSFQPTFWGDQEVDFLQVSRDKRKIFLDLRRPSEGVRNSPNHSLILPRASVSNSQELRAGQRYWALVRGMFGIFSCPDTEPRSWHAIFGSPTDKLPPPVDPVSPARATVPQLPSLTVHGDGILLEKHFYTFPPVH